jgi:hypothetical protein
MCCCCCLLHELELLHIVLGLICQDQTPCYNAFLHAVDYLCCLQDEFTLVGIVLGIFEIYSYTLKNKKPHTMLQYCFFTLQIVCAAPQDEFELVGIVLGLACYNSVIIDAHLPLPAYKKLMGLVS